MDTDKLSGIVVYTIHDNKSLRDALRNGIEVKFKALSLDESTYGIPIKGSILSSVIQTLRDICDKACKESDSVYSDKDHVCLYYPLGLEVSNERYIKQVYIVKPREEE